MALEGVVSKRADAPHTPERMVANLRANVPRFYPRVKRFRLFTSWHRCRAREASAPTEVSATAARAVPVGEGQRQNFPTGYLLARSARSSNGPEVGQLDLGQDNLAKQCRGQQPPCK